MNCEARSSLRFTAYREFIRHPLYTAMRRRSETYLGFINSLIVMVKMMYQFTIVPIPMCLLPGIASAASVFASSQADIKNATSSA